MQIGNPKCRATNQIWRGTSAEEPGRRCRAGGRGWWWASRTWCAPPGPSCASPGRSACSASPKSARSCPASPKNETTKHKHFSISRPVFFLHQKTKCQSSPDHSDIQNLQKLPKITAIKVTTGFFKEKVLKLNHLLETKRKNIKEVHHSAAMQMICKWGMQIRPTLRS